MKTSRNRACGLQGSIALGAAAFAALAALAALATVTTAHADYTRVETDPVGAPGMHRYVVWIDPEGEDHPMTGQEVASYCGAAELFSEHVWDATNGRHSVYQVVFHYGDQPATDSYDATWHRAAGTANASLLGGKFHMFDGILLCTHGWENQAGQLKTVLIDDPCGGGLSCEPNGIQYRERCIDTNGSYVPNGSQNSGFTMAHEAYHSHYGLWDQYATGSRPVIGHPEAYGFRFCSNLTTDTSVMADWHVGHWCDENTHLYQRWHDGILATQPDLESYNDWDKAKLAWVDLMDYYAGGSYTEGEYFVSPTPPQPFPPSAEPFCVFTGEAYNNAAVSDVMVVIDRSGSMNYTAPKSPVTAFEAAFSAGLEHYNLTPPGRLSGVSAYNTAVDQLRPYGPRPAGTYARPSDFPSLGAQGATDICAALTDAATQIRGQGGSPVAQVVLLSDGLPTAGGCNTTQQVLDAAYAACHPADLSAARVGISTVAYGNADFGLLNQITNICGGEVRAVDHNSPEAPDDLQVAVSRLAYSTRNFQEVLFDKRQVASTLQASFVVPDGSQVLEVAWVGDGFELAPAPDAPPHECGFSRYTMELLAPGGGQPATAPVPAAVQNEYDTRSLRVTSPQAGTWTMRLTTSDPCRSDNAGYTGYVPSVSMFAEVKNPNVAGTVAMPRTIAQNGRAVIQAMLEVGDYSAMTDISVTAKLVYQGGVTTQVTLRDDGNGDDETAGDGLYTGVYNGNCGMGGLPPAGARRVVVSFDADGATAHSVIRPASDIPPTSDLAQPTTAHVQVERSLVVEPCSDAAPECAGAPIPGAASSCVEPTVEIPAVIVGPGETRCGLTATITGAAVGSAGVRVGAGPGLRTHNVVSSYDDATDTSTITFCVTADGGAPGGTAPLCIQFGDQLHCTDQGVNAGVPLDVVVGQDTSVAVSPIGNVSMVAYISPTVPLSLTSANLRIDRLLNEAGTELVAGMPATIPRLIGTPFYSQYIGAVPLTTVEVFAVPFLGYYAVLNVAPVPVSAPNACLAGQPTTELTTALTFDDAIHPPMTAHAAETWVCLAGGGIGLTL